MPSDLRRTLTMTERNKRLFRLVLAVGFAAGATALTTLAAFLLEVRLSPWLGGANTSFLILMGVYTLLLFGLFEWLSVGYRVRSLFTGAE